MHWRSDLALSFAVILVESIKPAVAFSSEAIYEELLFPYMSNLSELCLFITCHEPVDADNCPEDSIFVEGISQFGCCGACVEYSGELDDCTGSIDPYYGAGYGTYTRSSEENNPTSKNFTKETLKEGKEDSKRLPKQLTRHLKSSSIQERNLVHSYWCNYNLVCGVSSTCERDPDNIGCRYIQLAYEDDIASGNYLRYRDEYRWRPDCDERGYFMPKQCKGSTEEEQICVCVDRTGETIFGKAFSWQTELYEDMNCLCSRKVAELQFLGLDSVTLHCKENGNYESLQCLEGWCLCVNSTTGETLSQVVPQSSFQKLPCYNETTQGAMYLRKCDSEYNARQSLATTLNGHSVNQFSASYLNCDPDGSYAGRQCDGSDCSCVDKLNNYLIAPSPSGSNCNCVRDQMTYEDADQYYDLTCETDPAPGQYYEKQQTGNIAYCVDLDGVRISPKVRAECLDYLSCANAKQCQLGTYANCELVCQGCPENAFFYNENFKESGDCA